MTGLPYVFRPVAGIRAPKNPVRGYDLAGVVEKVGENVIAFRTGDEVFGTADGSYAEYARARPDRLAKKPANLTFEEAAAVPISGYAALQAVRDHGNVQSGQRVLIIGAGGGVGMFAVQIAKADGAEVTGVSSSRKVDAVRAIGADRVIDYTSEDFTNDARRYDVILDIAGNRTLSHLRRALAPEGTLVIVGGEGGGKWFGGIDRQLRASALSLFVRQKLGTFVSKQRHDDLETLRELLETGHVTPVVDRVFPLDEAADAIRYLRNGQATGKLVIRV
jgi:NADPH:quinone reductase-like Zn-dependent oxidoreductase